MPTTTCSKCGKQFTHPTGSQANQALRMHEGRVHKKTVGPRCQIPLAKRTYHKKPKQIAVSVSFCPTCGCNLQAVAMGMAMGIK